VTFSLFIFQILQQQNRQNGNKANMRDPTKQKMQDLVGEILHGGNINNIRVLSYQNKTPAPEGYQNPLKVLHSQTDTSAGASTRYISRSPDRVLSAPDFINDYCE